MRILGPLSPAVLLVIGSLLLTGCKSAEDKAEEYYQRAIALLAEGDADRAQVELRNVFEFDGGHQGARRAMAELQMEKGNLRGAYRQYLHLAEQYPDDLESRIILAEMAFLAGNWDEVDRHGAKAEELAPEDPRVVAIALVRDYREAIRNEDEAERRNLGSRASEMLAEQSDSLALRNIVIDNSIREQDFTRALEEIDWMIANDPKDARYYTERLRVLATLGDMSAVEAQLREMIKVFPDDPTHKATLIRFYISRDNVDAAETLLRDLSAESEPEDPGPTVDLIRFLSEFRDTEAVRAEIQKAIAERPDPVPFQIMEAKLDFSLGNRSEAIEKLQNVLAGTEASEQSRDIKITLAKMLLATGNEVGARSNVEEVLAEEATNTEALKMQAAWQIEADDTDAAIGGLRVALDQSPQDAEAMTLLAAAYSRAGQPDLAKDILAQSVEASGNAPTESVRYASLLIGEEQFLPAEDILIAALRLAPTNTDLLITLGQLYLAMEDFGRVQGVVDSLRRIDSETAVQAANALEAERLNQQHSLGEAMLFLEGLANSSDASLATKIALIRAKLNTGDKAGALTLAQELRQDDPDNETLLDVLAVAQISNDNLEEAEAIYRELLETNPDRPRVWRSLSRLQLRQGDREAAKALVDEGLTHMPDNADLLWAKASFLEQDQEIDAAIEIYQSLYERNSNSLIVANNLASLLATHRDDEESLERAWTIARRLRDANAPALKDTYGWIVHRRGDSAEALPYLESAAEALKNDPLVQYHLGQVYVALDRKEDALVQFRKAVDVAGPVDTRPQIEEARALMQSLPSEDSVEN